MKHLLHILSWNSLAHFSFHWLGKCSSFKVQFSSSISIFPIFPNLNYQGKPTSSPVSSTQEGLLLSFWLNGTSVVSYHLWGPHQWLNISYLAEFSFHVFFLHSKFKSPLKQRLMIVHISKTLLLTGSGNTTTRCFTGWSLYLFREHSLYAVIRQENEVTQAFIWAPLELLWTFITRLEKHSADLLLFVVFNDF